MQDAINHYAAGADRIREAIRGLSDADLKAFPIPNTWSIHQIVIHLQDSDLVGVDRMKRLIAEENPLLIGYNETLFTSKLYYHDQPIEPAITLFDLARKQLAIVLRKLPAEAFDRSGIHNEVGKVNLGSQIKKYDQHLEHHLGFIRKKRALLGK